MCIDFSLLYMNLHLLPWMRHGAHGARETQETHAARGAYVCGHWRVMEPVGLQEKPCDQLGPMLVHGAHGIRGCS